MSQSDSGYWPKRAYIIPPQVIGHILVKDFSMGHERHENVNKHTDVCLMQCVYQLNHSVCPPSEGESPSCLESLHLYPFTII